MSDVTVAAEQLLSPEQEQALPNKFIYPEFAGFAGEKLMRRIVKAILPRALYITWETFEEEHAYGNDCFLSLSKVARDARRTQRTINRNIATLMSRGLLILRSEYKFCRRQDGSVYKKAVVVKDFSGLYALAHEYYEWQYAEDYLAPEYEYIEHIRSDSRLKAKLCRFEDYRRLLEHGRDPFAQVQEDPRFTEYTPEISYEGENKAEGAGENASCSNEAMLLLKESPKGVTQASKKRSNEKNYDEILENISPLMGKTRENVEKSYDVEMAHRAMEVSGIEPGGASHRADALPLPPKHPLARSFVHEVASVFGDLNEKGSKTGIERAIETFELEQPAAVLLCLVRAYVIARDTKAENIRHRHPETGAPNRMPLFCSMFKKLARALASGSPWDYSWQKLQEDVAADDRLSLWLSEHQAERATAGSTQADPPAFPEEGEGQKAQEQEAEAHEEVQEATAHPGWADGADAYVLGERLAQAIVDAGYRNAAVALREIEERFYVVYQVQTAEGEGEIVLSSEEEIAYLIEQAEQGQL